ncbi:MAG TPA: YciI family protein [Xanthobacteraceae bacterium]|nr:YciI family protein [Xanthobacteraceae bacterium]
MRFMMMMIPDVYKRPVPADFVPPADGVEKMGKFNEELRKAGVLLALDGLHPPGTAARISFEATGKPKVTDGPFAEAKEAIGGYWMLEVKSRDEAIEWAKRCPAQAGDVIEVRRVFAAEDFAPGKAG